MPDPIEPLWHWADGAIGDSVEFKCKYYTVCNNSINNELGEGEGCCMGYIGRDYGNNASKLVVVGIEITANLIDLADLKKIGNGSKRTT